VLIPPMLPPETNVDFIKRMAAVKANAEPNVIVLPKSDQEGDAEFASRMDVAKNCPGIVFPRGKSETADQFKQRMAQQAKSKQSILPRAVDESDKGFKKRIETQFLCAFSIHPFDPKRENEEQYVEVRLKAHRELPMNPIEPGEMDILKKFEFEMKKEAAYDVDASALNKKLEEEKAAKEAAMAAEEEARARAESAAEREERQKVNAAAEAAALEEKPDERDEQEKKVKELMARRKAEAEEKARLEEEDKARHKSFDEEAVNITTIGFMPLKRLLMERGVPKEAVFSCPNKVALRDVAAKFNCKLVFTEGPVDIS